MNTVKKPYQTPRMLTARVALQQLVAASPYTLDPSDPTYGDAADAASRGHIFYSDEW